MKTPNGRPDKTAPSWDQLIGRHLTPDGSVIVPPRIAKWLEDKAGMTADRRIMLRDTDPEAYEVLMALHLAAITPRSDCGTKDAEHQPNQPESVQWLTTNEAATETGVTDRCIRKRINDGRLLATRRGGQWLINRNDLRAHQLAA